ncbi:tRNA pseudouridine(38-40) synthase TruA [bacterium]|nr:tRNA pseudouridine(38-40) synthase TruA [bacterium]
MSKAFSEFKKIFSRHILGLPLTTLISAVLSGTMPFLRWPMHTAFLCALLREKKDGGHFPDVFLAAIIRHAPFFLVWVFLILPLLTVMYFVSAGFSIALGGAVFAAVLLFNVLFILVFFLLMHPLAFYLSYAWEHEEKGFSSDLKLLLSYLSHYFERPFSHVFFTLKCYLLYILGIVLVAFPVVLLFPFLYFPHYDAWHRNSLIVIFSLIILGVAFVFALAFFLLYLGPFFSFLTLVMYEPLAPKGCGGGEDSGAVESGDLPYGEVKSEQLKHWKLTVAYDGTRFCGWQVQPGVRTVQGELQAALKRLLREDVTVTACSRTDSGVHAQGQTVDFFTSRDIPSEKLLRALNTYTPEDISVTKIEEVAPDFHSTFSACGKHYRYTVFTGEADDVMTRNFHLLLRRDLNVEAMRQAAAFFVGEKEYKGLQVKSGKPEEATVRLVTAAEVRREGDLVLIDIWGKGFMYKQVRSMAGLLLAVGEGRVKPEETEGLMSGEAGVRKTEVAPPQGLTLVKVYYDQKEFDARS